MTNIIYTTTFRERENAKPRFCRMDADTLRCVMEEVGKTIRHKYPDAETYIGANPDGFTIQVSYENEDGVRVSSYYDITKNMV